MLFRSQIVSLCSFDPPTSAMFSQVLLVRALFTPPRMLVYVLVCGLLRAGGDTHFCMLVDAGSVCLVGVPLSMLGILALNMQLPAALALLFCADFISLVMCLLRFKGKIWVKTLI